MLAKITEENGVLTLRQSRDEALRDLQTALFAGVGIIPVMLVWYGLSLAGTFSSTAPGAGNPTHQDAGFAVGVFVLLCLPFVFMLFRALNSLFGKETFVFDKNQDAFIRNGFNVGPLSDIRAVKPQVTHGSEQNPRFRLVLEMRYHLPFTLVITHYFAAPGDFQLSQNGFGDPNKKFAEFEPWTDCDKQRLIPFVPPEIVDLQRKIADYIGLAQKAV